MVIIIIYSTTSLFVNGNNDVPPHRVVSNFHCQTSIIILFKLAGNGICLHPNAVKASDCCNRFSCTSDFAIKQVTKEAKSLHLDKGMDF